MMNTWLEGISGEYAGKRIFLSSNSLSIGRSTNSQLRLRAMNISREHAIINYTNGIYSIQDCNSRNGIAVNGNQVQSTQLQNGDVITIGASAFRFVHITQISPKSHQYSTAAESAKQKNDSIYLILVIIVIGFAMLVGIPIIPENNHIHATQTAYVIATNEARLTATAAYETTRIATYGATATAAYKATERIEQYYEFEQSFTTETIYKSSKPIQMREKNSDGYMESNSIKFVGDYILEMTVTNPSDVSNGFDYGFLYHDSGGDQYLMVFTDASVSDTSISDTPYMEISFSRVISGDGGSWILLYKGKEDSEYEVIISGYSSNFYTGNSDTNAIEFISYDGVGYLYINDEFITELDLANSFYNGLISICTDVIQDNGKPGNIVQFDSVVLKEITN